MARRKKKPDVIIHEYGNTGIVDNRRYELLSETGRAWARQHNSKPLSDRLDEIEQSLCGFVKELRAVAEVNMTGAADVTNINVKIDNDSIKHLPQAMKEAVADAMLGIGLVEVVRRGIASGDANHAATYAYQLGMLGMQLEMVRPNEHHARRGKVVKKGASDGGLASQKLKGEQRDTARNERERLISLGHTKKAACDLVAEQFQVSYKTISRL